MYSSWWTLCEGCANNVALFASCTNGWSIIVFFSCYAIVGKIDKLHTVVMCTVLYTYVRVHKKDVQVSVIVAIASEPLAEKDLSILYL